MRTSSSGLVLVLVSYMDMLIQDEDSSGLQLQLATEAGAGAGEMERLVIAHQLPRLVVMGGVRTWRTFAVCHRSCLNTLDEDDLTVHSVTVFAGPRGTRARLGVLLDNGTDIAADLADTQLTAREEFSFATVRVDRALPVRGTDLWLQCDYNTLADTAAVTMLGGLGRWVGTKYFYQQCKYFPPAPRSTAWRW